MHSLLKKEKELEFWVADTFSGKMLSPIIKNTLYKAENGWDDYDEVYYCCRLIENVKKNPDMTMDFHYITCGENVIGLGLISYGKIDTSLFFHTDFQPQEPLDKILIFNYFHVAPEGRGNGEHWLRDIILPSYNGKGYEACYVKSSHPKVFSLYGRLGQQVGEYSCKSDNGLYIREGKIFRIPLGR